MPNAQLSGEVHLMTLEELSDRSGVALQAQRSLVIGAYEQARLRLRHIAARTLVDSAAAGSGAFARMVRDVAARVDSTGAAPPMRDALDSAGLLCSGRYEGPPHA